MGTADTEAAPIVDPDTYLTGVPHDLLRALRAESAVRWVPEPDGPGFWAVLRHAEVRHVLRTPAVFSSHLGATQIRDPAPEALAYVRRMMLNQDPPDHNRLRGLLTRAFNPRAIARLTERIEGWARELVGRIDGDVDFAKDVAADLPLLTLAEVFGVPAEDRWLMFDWGNRVIGYQDAEYAASATAGAGSSDLARAALALRPEPDADGRMPDPRTRAGMPDLYAYAHGLGEVKRHSPGADVMSTVMSHVDDSAGRVSIDEFENLFWLFSVAGNETLRNGIPGGLIALMSHVDSYRALRDRPDLVDNAVEEMLRWWTPVMHFRRTATVDTELGGTRIGAGEKVVVWFSSANRDERVFADPDTFDLTRAEAGEHLGFGHGPHFCLGAHLARVQMRALFRAVLALPWRLEPAGPAVRLRSNFQNGIKSLPVTRVAW